MSAFDQVDAQGQTGKQLPNAALNAFKNVNTATIKPFASDEATPWGTAWGATTEGKSNEGNDLDKSSKPFKFGAGQGSKISNSNLPPFGDPRSYQPFQVFTFLYQCFPFLTIINVFTWRFRYLLFHINDSLRARLLKIHETLPWAKLCLIQLECVCLCSTSLVELINKLLIDNSANVFQDCHNIPQDCHNMLWLIRWAICGIWAQSANQAASLSDSETQGSLNLITNQCINSQLPTHFSLCDCMIIASCQHICNGAPWI